jgi:hypothetical protein
MQLFTYRFASAMLSKFPHLKKRVEVPTHNSHLIAFAIIILNKFLENQYLLVGIPYPNINLIYQHF